MTQPKKQRPMKPRKMWANGNLGEQGTRLFLRPTRSDARGPGMLPAIPVLVLDRSPEGIAEMRARIATALHHPALHSTELDRFEQLADAVLRVIGMGAK